MNVPFVDLRAQYQSIKDDIDVAINKVIAGGIYIRGPEVQAFEEEMALYCETTYAVGVASGTDALHLALLACGIKPGDEVITTPFTFAATTEVIKHCGAKPVFADIDPKTYTIDPAKIASKVSRKAKAIIPVHLYGQSCEMDPIMEIARKKKLLVIEDCAQALGAEYKGKKVGSIGDVGCLSFFPVKSLGAYGDGGMVITDSEEIAEKVRMLRIHGAKEPFKYVLDGFNSRLDEIQAAILRVKLKHLDKWIELRGIKASTYDQLLNKVDGVDIPFAVRTNKHSYNFYTICVTSNVVDRDGLQDYLRKEGIQTVIYYPLSLHLQEPYKELRHKKGDFKNSEWAQERVISLPIYPELSEEQIERVINKIDLFISGDIELIIDNEA
jgi:dTDP-4-amino-4,6-dideoxygalactose transaminase